MYATYNFHFLDTISQQLSGKLEAISISPLDLETLGELESFQKNENAVQGVYLLHYKGQPVYLGKAENVHSRLVQHLAKLSGRKNIDLGLVGYKALILDKSMSTAANEDVLIGIFQKTHTGMWNGSGFGPKDPGKKRDNTRPGLFDRTYPINENFPIELTADTATAGDVLATMKRQLPYVFRYDLDGETNASVDLREVPRTAQSVLHAVVRSLGHGWKGVILSYGMVLYRTDATYEFGQELLP